MSRMVYVHPHPHPHPMCYETLMNKTNSPLTSKINGHPWPSPHVPCTHTPHPHHLPNWVPLTTNPRQLTHPHPTKKGLLYLNDILVEFQNEQNSMCGQVPSITSSHIHEGKIKKKKSSKTTYIEQSTDRPNCIKFQSSNLKRTSGMQRNSKSLFGRLCAYLMSCDTHLRDIYTKNIPAKFQKYLKYFSSYPADKLGHTDGETDGRTEGQTGGRSWRQYQSGLRAEGSIPHCQFHCHHAWTV